MAKSVDYRSKQARLHGLWERLHMKEKFFSGKKTNKQTYCIIFWQDAISKSSTTRSLRPWLPSLWIKGSSLSTSWPKCAPFVWVLSRAGEPSTGKTTPISIPDLHHPNPQKLTPLSKSCKEYCYIRSWKYVFWHDVLPRIPPTFSQPKFLHFLWPPWKRGHIVLQLSVGW